MFKEDEHKKDDKAYSDCGREKIHASIDHPHDELSEVYPSTFQVDKSGRLWTKNKEGGRLIDDDILKEFLRKEKIRARKQSVHLIKLLLNKEKIASFEIAKEMSSEDFRRVKYELKKVGLIEISKVLNTEFIALSDIFRTKFKRFLKEKEFEIKKKILEAEEVKNALMSKEEKIEEFLKKYYEKDINYIGYVGGKYSLTIDFFKLRFFDENLAEDFLKYPEEMIKIAEHVLNKILASYPKYKRRVNLRVENLPSVRKILIKDITTDKIDELWCFEGIVRRVTDVRPRLALLVYECVHCGNVIKIEADGEKIQKPGICPSCERKGPFNLILKESMLVDFQKLVVQESYEDLKGGEQPKLITVYVMDDLINKAMPGNRVEIVGIPKAVIDKNNVNLRIYFKAISIKPIEVEFEEIEITPEDVKEIKKLAKRPDLFEILTSSIAPHIYGHTEIKEAIILQLFGAPPVILENGRRIRGDSHILLIGEPSTGKSEILASVKEIAPRCVFTAGKGATTAGLTAAVIREEGEGFILEAGALPLADKGICIIDEFEKMDSKDVVALHEGMEQQQISIAKAGIVATLKSRCSILAAANPKYGRFDEHRSLSEQINIPPTILSRFDLIFFVRDDLSQTREVARHILDTYERPQDIKPPIDTELLKKYIAYARKNINPKLTREAREVIEDFYVKIREKAMQVEDSPIPLTARQLHAIVRLARASARARLSNEVTKEDAERAIRLVKTSLMQAGIDLDTGKIDIDKIMVGITKSQREKIKIVREIIEELESVYGEAEESEILREAERRGLDYPQVVEILQIMERNGEIFKTKPYCYKLKGKGVEA